MNVVRVPAGREPPPPPAGDKWILQPAARDLLKFDGLSRGHAGLAYAPPLEYGERLSARGPVPLGGGQAQLREIVSALRMRSFEGRYNLVVPRGDPFTRTPSRLDQLWSLLP